jgi:hypothetical protein
LKKEINIYLTLSEEDQLFTSAERIAKKWFKNTHDSGALRR